MRRRSRTWLLGAFQNCHAITQALCHAAFLLGPLPQKVNVPTEAINWLTAHAAKSRAQCVFGFTVRRGRRAECERQAAPAAP
jgi:hypothetical protein